MSKLFKKNVSDLDYAFFGVLLNGFHGIDAARRKLTFVLLPLISAGLFAVSMILGDYIVTPMVGIFFAISAISYQKTARRKLDFYKHQVGYAEDVMLDKGMVKAGEDAEKAYGKTYLIEVINATRVITWGFIAIWLYIMFCH